MMRMRFPILAALLLIPWGELAAQQHHRGQTPQAQTHAAATPCGMPTMSGAMPTGGAMHAAQGHAMGAGMTMSMDVGRVMGGPPMPNVILEHARQLDLTAAQTSRLQTLQNAALPACQQHMQMAMAAHQAASQILDEPAPDFAAYEAKLQVAAGHMIQGHVVMSRAAVEARAMLTAAQRQRLDTLLQQAHQP